MHTETPLADRLETRVPAKDLHCSQYVSIFIIFRSRKVSATQTVVKTEFNAK